MTREVCERIGCAKTVLVFVAEPAAQAAVTTVVVRVGREKAERRLVTRGDIRFEANFVDHLHATVLPVADRIIARVGLSACSFVISVAGLAATAACGLDLHISGRSMDVSVLLALLSARLKLPLRQDVVATGALSTDTGTILPVQGLPAKLAAAFENPDITRFVLPSVNADPSMARLAPQATEEIASAIAQAKQRLDVVEVCTVEELLGQVVTDRARALSALRAGYFERSIEDETENDAVDGAARLLLDNHQQRFWGSLSEHLLGRRTADAKQLLQAWARYHIDHAVYPMSFGARLTDLLASLPPAKTRGKALGRLLPIDQCVAISRFAGKTDLDDVDALFPAAAGKVKPRETPALPAAPHLPDGKSTQLAAAVLRAISASAVAANVGIPIDTARATYMLPGIVAESHEAFLDTVAAFFRHLLRHVGVEGAAVDGNCVASESLALLARAFHGQGGVDAAWAEAQGAIHGGLSLVLNAMTEQFKREHHTAYVSRILTEAISPLDWEARVAFIDALLERVQPLLSPELRGAPPERFAGRYEDIAQAYSRSLDQLDALLRRL